MKVLVDLKENKYNVPLYLKCCISHHYNSKRREPSTHGAMDRMVIDFRKIIEQYENWSYPLMRIGRIFSKLHDMKIFSTYISSYISPYISISSYYNITVTEDSKTYTAFTTEYGKYEFPWIPLEYM